MKFTLPTATRKRLDELLEKLGNRNLTKPGYGLQTRGINYD